MEFDIKLYDREFFKWHKDNVHESAMRCMDWYIEMFKPGSVIDFGCGIGSYLESCFNHGIMFGGIEISEHALEYMHDSVKPHVDIMDCTNEDLSYIGRIHTVISFETAEHIEPSGTSQFILNLVRATGKTLLFTAAPPGQEGTGHINCRPQEFWLNEFAYHLNFDEDKTKEISEAWERLGAPWYIVKNLLVFNR